ncbi:MAG: hypothetical protein M3044_06845 [Thermoproteota archaeon]|nr:hypothetical protein [Thermoproteota archaeon]
MTEFDSELNVIIAEIKKEFKHFLIKRKELIIKLGTAYEKVVANTESICEEIKNVLRDEIAQKLISSRDIERYCLDKWKTKTKPKNDNLSFSKPVEDGQPRIAVTHTGESVIVNETSSNAETYPKGSDGINQSHDQSKQNGTRTDDNNEEGTGDADSKEESMVRHSLNGENASASKQLEDSGKAGKKEVFVSHIPMSFEHLRKDMEAVFQITKGVGNVWFHVTFDVGTAKVTLDFCGNKQKENDAMISTGQGPMRTNS